MTAGDIEKWSRERAFGNDPDVLTASRVVVVGAGALGNNLLLTLALLGVRQVDVIDHDHVEPHNPTRSPLFSRALGPDPVGRPKAEVVARSFVALSEHDAPVARYVVAPFQALGLGILHGAAAVVSCVDRYDVRVDLARAARLMRVPLIDAGFFGTAGNVSTFANRDADEPCPQCLFGPPAAGGASCSLYAHQATAAGRVPAAQSVACAIAGIQAEQLIRALHGVFPLARRHLSFDVRDGTSALAEVVRSPRCAGAHRVAKRVLQLDVGPQERVGALLAATERETGAAPTIELTHGIVWTAPCARCARTVDLALPDWAERRLPLCPDGCAGMPLAAPGELRYIRMLRSDLERQLLDAPLSRFGVAPGDVLMLAPANGHDEAPDAVVLAGDPLSAFSTVARSDRA